MRLWLSTGLSACRSVRSGEMNWRPGRDSDPGPAGDSRIYWTELYYLGISAARIHDNSTN